MLARQLGKLDVVIVAGQRHVEQREKGKGMRCQGPGPEIIDHRLARRQHMLRYYIQSRRNTSTVLIQVYRDTVA